MNAKAFISKVTDPWINLAFEEWLFRKPSGLLSPNTVYLWRNTPCVVIGRNQNPWKECNLPLMRAAKIPLIRRRSGGGTVVHNLGNTNYTCFMPRDAFNRDSSAQIVAQALHQLDIPASVNKRHDIVVDGMKVSGSAFKVVHERAYAHGTMLISSDLVQLGSLLKSPRKEKIVGRGVESVPSKVTRLIDHSYTVTHTDFCRAVAEEYGKVFTGQPGLKNEMVELTMDDYTSDPKLQSYYDEIRTDEWKWGSTPTFTHEMEQRFIWGNVKITLTVTESIIATAETIFTPASASSISESSIANAVSAFFVNMPYDDGKLSTLTLLNDMERWKMGASGLAGKESEEVYEWIKSEIWSGIETI
ncbi:Lipoyltransferase and lipoate-protein ligase [Rhizoclosmatium globosum]|uniref:Putative lipoate-protein ligase A n=1 Tax=Rhizoclosmatium globosum TaxID=329046 RepID=A0A1Y2CZJ2_9FUNG|nr:Lipoyltransferase and lipoate-protein ligase [Rhizoclosmatium globosum]|eukprot:ORY52296.1 Lipoyltransferase and lipoate-protein ligase [Rhizoclosmatium globosum]